ncbi:hypothetical protein P4O66_000514 [Electrophorus voltai]|uniref:Uncharacterized protein n=1 Tax=Electrophorus voltai TaxID=2609070 RepID=A0AAD8ZFB5_9TELE|nr:hypothetical protein P4O66_000514 [Electrophorus voltai]
MNSSWFRQCLMGRSPVDEEGVHHSFSQLIQEQTQDLDSYKEAIEMCPLETEEKSKEMEGNTPRNFLRGSGPEAVEPGPRRTEGHRKDQKEGGLVEPAGSPESLPLSGLASKTGWVCPKPRRQTTSGTLLEQQERGGPLGEVARLEPGRNICWSVPDCPERGREAAFLPLAVRSPLLEAPGRPDDALSLSGPASSVGADSSGSAADPLVERWSSDTLRVLSSMPSRTIADYWAS